MSQFALCGFSLLSLQHWLLLLLMEMNVKVKSLKVTLSLLYKCWLHLWRLNKLFLLLIKKKEPFPYPCLLLHVQDSIYEWGYEWEGLFVKGSWRIKPYRNQTSQKCKQWLQNLILFSVNPVHIMAQSNWGKSIKLKAIPKIIRNVLSDFSKPEYIIICWKGCGFRECSNTLCY